MLETINDLWTVGWSAGFTGTTRADVLADVRRALGLLTVSQAAAVADGHAAGVRDAEGYRKDMARREDVPVTPECEIPF